MLKPIAERLRGLSLGTRIFLGMAVVVAVSILVSVLVTSLGAARIARRSVARALSGSQMAQSAFQQERREHLRVMARSLALDPYVTAYAAEAEGTVYASSILHLLEQRRQDFQFGFAIVLDPRGRVLARTDRPGTSGQDLASMPLVAAALQRSESAGVWQEGQALFDAVVVPLARETTLFGYFVVGFPLDDSQALEVKRITGTDVAYIAATPNGPVIVASTLDAETQAELSKALVAKPGAATGSESQVLEMSLGGRVWAALTQPLDAGGASGAAAVAVAPLDVELQPFVQITRLLAVAGLLALVLAFALSWALAQRTLRPLGRLATAAAAARRGDYEQPVDIHGGREVSELARAFHTLLADLREKRDMESYIADLSRSLPAPAFEESTETLASTLPVATAGRSESVTVRSTPTPTARGVPQSGDVLANRYEIHSTLGRGGMGVVLKAHDRDLDEIVALKLLRTDIAADPVMLERLKNEVKLARKITHANVLRTFDFLDLDGIPCISMEYVHGVTLRALLAQSERLPYSAGLHLARQLGEGLQAAHAEGVLHRDIKPENVILMQNGTAKLMDFGIARPVRRLEPGKTEAGSIVGTPHYLAPEQLTGGVVDTRADIYACGVLLYEVFTGGLPFRGDTEYEILVKHLQERPESPRAHWPEIPPEMEEILLRCLEREPGERFTTVAALLLAIESARSHLRMPARADA